MKKSREKEGKGRSLKKREEREETRRNEKEGDNRFEASIKGWDDKQHQKSD